MLTEKLKWYHSPKEFKQPANDWTSHTQTDLGESALIDEAVEEGVPHGDRQLTAQSVWSTSTAITLHSQQ